MGGTRGWVVALAMAGLAACGGAPEGGDDGTEDEVLGTLTQESSGDTVARAAPGALEWARFSKGPETEYGRSVAVDRDGNVVVVVTFTGSVDLGSGPLGSGEPYKEGFVLAKYSPAGKLLWTRVFQDFRNGALYVRALGVDRERDIVLMGWSLGATEDTARWDGKARLPREGGFLAKFDKRGALKWVKSLKGDGTLQPESLAVDRQDNIFVAGSVIGEDSVDFGGESLASVEGEARAFLVKYSPDGKLRWLHAENSSILGGGVALDEAGDAYFCIDSLSETPSIFQPTLRRLSGAKGTVRWSRSLEDGICGDVAVHGNRVVMAGSFAGTFMFGGKEYTAESPSGGGPVDAFLVAWTLAGEPRWADNFGWTGIAVAMDPNDGVLVTGTYSEGDAVHGELLPAEPGSVEGGNVFVAKFDRIDGRLRWVRGFASSYATPLEVAVSREGEGVVVGGYGVPMDFGTGEVDPDVIDAFILRFAE